MFIFTLILLINLVFSFDLYRVDYTKPGHYKLDGSIYGTAKNIVVEMWGAGGSGNCVYDSPSYGGNGGGSGAYIHANLPTFINDTYIEYDIFVGKGGTFSISDYKCYYQTENGDTIIYNNEHSIILLAGKGSHGFNAGIIIDGGCNITGIGIGGRYLISDNILIHNAIVGNNGTSCTIIMEVASISVNGNGGNAPFGGNGGYGGIGAPSPQIMESGFFPGGGGSGSRFGADGMVRIMFVKSMDIHTTTSEIFTTNLITTNQFTTDQTTTNKFTTDQTTTFLSTTNYSTTEDNDTSVIIVFDLTIIIIILILTFITILTIALLVVYRKCICIWCCSAFYKYPNDYHIVY